MDVSNFLYSKSLALLSTQSMKADQVIRRSSNYHPTVWGDYFINLSTNDMKPDPEVEKRIESLKEDVGKLLSNAEGKALEEMTLIDSIQRLGVAYHFENQINMTLQSIYKSFVNFNNNNNDDLYTISLRFRLLRQQGYTVSSDVFKKFMDKGKFEAVTATDAKVFLCLFETTHLRVHGEDTLEQALQFSRRQLETMLVDLKTPLAQQVNHSLELPLHKRMQRLEARHYISIYETNAARNDVLLELAKLDFNRLQKLYQRELNELSRWWKDIDFASKLPFARDRLVECYFWMLGVYFEPEHCLSRKYMTKIIALASVIDDIYDVYGTLEELKLFTNAIERWEVSAANDLPEYMEVCYLAVIDVVKEMEKKLENKGGSYRVYYGKEAIKSLVRAYFVEAIWFNCKYVPTFEEYLEISVMSSGYPMLAVQALVGLETVATKEAFDWAIKVPGIIRSSALIARLVDDIHTYKVEEERGDAPSSVQCYMKDHNISEDKACKKIKEMVDVEWKNINEQIQEPNHLPSPLLLPSLNLARMMEVLYQNGDFYTNSSGKTKNRIASILVDPVPI